MSVTLDTINMTLKTENKATGVENNYSIKVRKDCKLGKQTQKRITSMMFSGTDDSLFVEIVMYCDDDDSNLQLFTQSDIVIAHTYAWETQRFREKRACKKQISAAHALFTLQRLGNMAVKLITSESSDSNLPPKPVHPTKPDPTILEVAIQDQLSEREKKPCGMADPLFL